jgi:hypothetical protein
MIDRERGEFVLILNRLAVTFGKDVTPELGAAYWEALKDLELATVKQCAEGHCRRGKFFPKPVELRPPASEPVVTRSAAMDASFLEGERRAIENLEELRRQDKAAWRAEVRVRYDARRGIWRGST